MSLFCSSNVIEIVSALWRLGSECCRCLFPLKKRMFLSDKIFVLRGPDTLRYSQERIA